MVYFQVGVHIADVSHFIRPGTAIDKEAANRSTTVYLTDRRIDMVIFKFFISTPLNKTHFLLNVICLVQRIDPLQFDIFCVISSRFPSYSPLICAHFEAMWNVLLSPAFGK